MTSPSCRVCGRSVCRREKSEQLTHQAGGPVGVLLDLHDVLERRVGRPVVGEQEIRVADDGREHVVEIVGDAAGELADGLHLLRLREILLQRALFGGVERIDRRAAGALLPRWGHEQAGGASVVAADRDVHGRDVALGGDGVAHCAFQRRPVALEHAVVDRPLAPVPTAQGGRHHLQKGGVGLRDDAVGIGDRDGHRRGVEHPGEANLGGAEILARFLARRAADHQRARGAGQAVLPERDAVQQANGQALAAAALQVHVEALGAHLARTAGDAGEQGGAAARHEIGQGEAAGADLGEIVVQPGGQGGVHVTDVAVGAAGKEAGGGMVEEVDGVLEFLEDVLVALALAGDVGDAPQADVARTGYDERADPHAVPSRGPGRWRQRRRKPQFFRSAPAVPRRLGQAINRLGNLRSSGKQPLDATQLAAVLGLAQAHVIVVGVQEATAPVGDEQTFQPAVANDTGDVAAQRPPGELEQADRVAEQCEDADHGEQREQADDEVARVFPRQNGERHRGADQQGGEQDHQARAAGALGRMKGRGRHGFAHAARRLRSSDRRRSAQIMSARPCRVGLVFATAGGRRRVRIPLTIC